MELLPKWGAVCSMQGPRKSGIWGAPSLLEQHSHLTSGIIPCTLADQKFCLRIPSSLFLVLFCEALGVDGRWLWEEGGIRLKCRTERGHCLGQEEEVPAEVRAALISAGSNKKTRCLQGEQSGVSPVWWACPMYWDGPCDPSGPRKILSRGLYLQTPKNTVAWLGGATALVTQQKESSRQG